MSEMPAPAWQRVVSHRAVTTMLLTFFAVTTVWSAAYFSGVVLKAEKVIVDFDAFYVVGQMVWEGILNEAYYFDTISLAQERLTGTDSFMPWTYPPQFDFIAAGLALMPRTVSQVVFVGASLVGFLVALRAIAGAYFGLVLLIITPAMLVTILGGQNGFLTGMLIAWFCAAALRGGRWAGLPLGLMIVKPHLAIGFAVMVTAGRMWWIFVVAAAVVIVTSALSTLAFGPGIWRAFLDAGHEAAQFLEQGRYPLFRMTSIYAALFTSGFPPGLAIAVQGLVALCALLGIAMAAWKGLELRHLLGLTALGSLIVSPYNYDYDLTLLGVVFALLLPELLERVHVAEAAVILALSWFATGCGLAFIYGAGADTGPASDLNDQFLPSGAAIGYLLLAAMVLTVLNRDPVRALDH